MLAGVVCSARLDGWHGHRRALVEFLHHHTAHLAAAVRRRLLQLPLLHLCLEVLNVLLTENKQIFILKMIKLLWINFNWKSCFTFPDLLRVFSFTWFEQRGCRWWHSTCQGHCPWKVVESGWEAEMHQTCPCKCHSSFFVERQLAGSSVAGTLKTP